MSDNYEFEKSRIPQGTEYESPYVAKNWNYVPDINSGIYANSGGPCLINFDLTSIFNSQQLIDPSQMFVTIPIVLVNATVLNPTNATMVNPKAGNAWTYAGLKSGYWNLIHQADLMLNGKPVETTQPYLNVYTHVKMLSQMSQDDLKTLGTTLGMGDCLDNPQSLKYNSPLSPYASTATGSYPLNAVGKAFTGIYGGNGITNNMPFPMADNTANAGDLELSGTEYLGTYNNGYYSRLKKVADTSVTPAANAFSSCLFGPSVGTNNTAATIMTAQQLSNEFKSFSVISNPYTIVYDVAIIDYAICLIR